MHISGAELLSDVTMGDLFEVISENPSLRGYLHGYLAELYLRRQLLSIPGILSASKIPDRDSQKGDLLVSYQANRLQAPKTFTIEVKSLSARGLKEDLEEGGISGIVSIKGSDSASTESGSRTTCLLKGQFDILAICTFSINGKWEYRYIHNKYLPTSADHEDRLRSKIRVNLDNTPCLHSDIFKVIKDLN